MKTILALFLLAFSFLSFAGEDIPAPKGVVGDPETIEDAARVVLPSRTEISLNGLWRSRPIVDDEPADVVPAGDWGWAKIPAFLTRDGVGSALEDQETFYAPRFADEIRKSKEFAKSVHERRWYRRAFTMPSEARGRRVKIRFAHVFTRCEVFVDGARVGEVAWPNGEVDVTSAARPGETQTVALRLTCYMPEDMQKDGDSFMGVGLHFKSQNRVRRVRDMRGLTGDVTLALEPLSGARATFAWGELADLLLIVSAMPISIKYFTSHVERKIWYNFP